MEEEPEDFQGVTRDGLRIVGLTRLSLKFGGLRVRHPVLIAESIAHKFILGNDFMSEYKCDIINSEGIIQFGNQRVPVTLFRSTVNLICLVICTGATLIGPHEEAVIPCLLDAATQYEQGQLLLLEPRNTGYTENLIVANVLISYNSCVVPLLLLNLSAKPMMILKNKVLADDTPATPINIQDCGPPALTVSAAAATPVGHRRETSPIELAMSNADASFSLEQCAMLKTLLSKHLSFFSAGP